MIGGLSRTATAALRQLLDAGTFSNQPSGFKNAWYQLRDEAQPIQPGEFRDVDAPGGNLKDAFMPLPFKEPSQNFITINGCCWYQQGKDLHLSLTCKLEMGTNKQQLVRQLLC